MLRNLDNKATIDKVFIDFHKFLLNYVSARINNRDDAADLVQEVFLKAAMKVDSLRDDEKIKGWILTIAKNAIIDYYRKGAKAQETVEIDNLLGTLSAPETKTTEIALEKCLSGFIKELPEEYRAIIEDSEIKGIRQKDLVDKYGIAYPSVRSRVQRGRGKLKEMFLKCCEIELDNHGNILQATPRTTCEDNCGDNN